LNHKRPEWTNNDIVNSNWRRKEHIENTTMKLLGYYADPQKKRRKDNAECKYCFYVNNSRIGGAAITTVNCRICNNDISFGSTATDVLCQTCATEHKLCKRCGAKMD
jgi:hypothetical protein